MSNAQNSTKVHSAATNLLNSKRKTNKKKLYKPSSSTKKNFSLLLNHYEMLRIYSVLLHKAKVSTNNKIHILHSFPARDRESLMTVNSTNCWLNGGSGRDEERGCGGSQLELKRLLSYISSIHRQLALQNGTITAPHLLQHQTHKHPRTLSEKAREIYADIKSQHLHT